jgi:hypothetical protein
MNEELQAAIITALAAGLTPLPVYGAVPQGADWPYVACGTPSSEPRDTDSSLGALVRIPVRLFSAQGAIAAATGFVDQVRDTLHHTDLTIASATVVTVYVEGSSVEEPSEDGKARETVVTVAILVDDITTATA